MLSTRLWFSRVVAVYALLIYTFLAYLYLVEPAQHIDAFGVSITGTPESINFLRAGPGALFGGMALVVAMGLFKPTRLRDALFVVVLFTGVVVAVRLYGMASEGITDMQVRELRNEGISWLFFLLALVLHPPQKAAFELD